MMKLSKSGYAITASHHQIRYSSNKDAHMKLSRLLSNRRSKNHGKHVLPVAMVGNVVLRQPPSLISYHYY